MKKGGIKVKNFMFIVYNSVMESANRSNPMLFNSTRREIGGEQTRIEIRIATQNDLDLVTNLAQNATYRHRHVDWFELKEFLDRPTFLLSKHQNGDQGAIAVFPDTPGAAWVRFAAVNRVEGNRHEAFLQLAEMFNMVIPPLQRENVTEIGWMSHLRWPDRWVKPLGFDTTSEMITYGKEAFELPPARQTAGLKMRSAFPEDMRTLAAIEARAFEPIWRHSARSLHFAWRDALSFDIASVDSKIVGFQHSTRHGDTAHLARLTVDPAYQGSGVGSNLLIRAIKNYQKAGVTQITLNTEVDNEVAQRLYTRFGFKRTGYNIPLWRMKI